MNDTTSIPNPENYAPISDEDIRNLFSNNPNPEASYAWFQSLDEPAVVSHPDTRLACGCLPGSEICEEASALGKMLLQKVAFATVGRLSVGEMLAALLDLVDHYQGGQHE